MAGPDQSQILRIDFFNKSYNCVHFRKSIHTFCEQRSETSCDVVSEWNCMSSIVLKPSNPQYSTTGPWSAWAGAWGAGSLTYGVDYTQTIALDNTTFPNGTLFSWSFPLYGGPFGVWSYPCIVYGSTPELINSTVPSTQVANLSNLSTTYSAALTVNSGQLDTIFDIWLTSKPYGDMTTAKYELEIIPQTVWHYSPLTYTFTNSTLQNANVYVNPNWGGNPWTNIVVAPSSEMLTGTISISDILKSLIWHGVITGQEYISGIEFGPEPGSGSGSLLINSLNYQWSGTPTITGTAGNDTFKITASGGNDIVGKGGIDTVIYSGAFSQFQIKSSASEILVTQNKDISTLDYLQGITYIKFSDGTYDTVTSTFAAASPTVTAVATSGTGITNGNGDLNYGHVVTLTLTMNEVVIVSGGTPTLTLNDGGTATYTGGSGSNALTFKYTVAAGQNTPDLTVTAFNVKGASVVDGAGNIADFANGVTNPTGTLEIDTTPPPPPVIASDTVNQNETVTLNGTAEADTTITVCDGQNSLGQAQVDATGAWSFTTAALTKGFHTLTATVTDAAGNISAASKPSDPAVGSTVIHTDSSPYGSTSLTQVSDNYYLWDSSGTGPELGNAGAAISAGDLGGWAPIGAVKTASGFDVGWKMAGASEYAVWRTDSNGNFLSNIVDALKSIEPTSNQNGLYVSAGATVVAQFPAPFGAISLGAGAAVELPTAASSSITFTGPTGTLKLDQPSTFSGTIFGFTGDGSLSGSDQIDLKGINFSAVQASFANGVLSVTDGAHGATLNFHGTYTLANFKFADDGNGGTIVYDPPAPNLPSTRGGTQVAIHSTNDAFVFHPNLGLSGSELKPETMPNHNEHPEFAATHSMMHDAHDNAIADFAHDVTPLHNALLAQLHQSHFLV